MKAVTCFLTLMSVLATGQAMYWEPCADAKGSIQKVTLVPETPAPGVTVQFAIEGTADIDVPTGNLNIAVAYMGLEIFTSSEDICDKTTCPIKKGPVVIAYSQYLPPIVPPGPYAVTINATSTAGEQLLCLIVNFQIQPPQQNAAEVAAEKLKDTTDELAEKFLGRPRAVH